MPKKFVYFNATADIVSAEIAEHLKKIGYAPVFSVGIDLASAVELGDFFEPYKNDLVGAVLANPPIDIMRGDIENTGDETWNIARDSFAVPMLNMTQVVGKILSEKKGGNIIYLNSIHAEKPIGSGFLYTTGCAAVQMLCREAALIYGSYNVGCYNVMRGIVEGEESFFASDYSPIHHNPNLRFPKEKLPPADAINELCAFLLGGGAYILNGADLHADEGFGLYFGKSGYYK
ncbi:MAG: SDR family oxidoreductase [Oscillospiraceae bacterium]|nr:SDR family oxidoreductase [Oscillospiraceae bacterium]